MAMLFHSLFLSMTKLVYNGLKRRYKNISYNIEYKHIKLMLNQPLDHGENRVPKLAHS